MIGDYKFDCGKCGATDMATCDSCLGGSERCSKSALLDCSIAWQPIKTAPRDGTEILMAGWNSAFDIWEFGVVKWVQWYLEGGSN